jgi:hypothetical protein
MVLVIMAILVMAFVKDVSSARWQEMSGINTDPYRACIADVAHHMDTGGVAEQLAVGKT